MNPPSFQPAPDEPEGFPRLAGRARDGVPGELGEVGSGMAGRRFGRFVVVRRLGGGACADVYLARQDEPRREVALKVIKPEATSDRAVRRFRQEAQALASLNHPNVATVFDAQIDGLGDAARPYIAMEHVPDAEPLVLGAMRRKLPLRRRLELMVEVCDAVRHAHARTIVHRDIKPANILISGGEGAPEERAGAGGDEGGGGGAPPPLRVKLIDFGVCVATDPRRSLATMQTEVGQLVGTPWYMSPEQTRAQPDRLGPESDVYSLGVVLYELVLERLPYVLMDKGIEEVLETIREAAPLARRPGDPRLPAGLWNVMMKALHKDRGGRYRDAGELQADLEAILGGRTVSARRDPAWRRGWSRLRRAALRNPAPAQGAAVLAAVLGTLAVSAITPLSHVQAVAAQRAAIWWFDWGHTVETLERTALVLFTDATDREHLRRAIGVGSGASPAELERRLISAVLTRLAGARAAGVMVDFAVSEIDDPGWLHGGVEDLRAAGTPVVFAWTDWGVTLQRLPPGIQRSLASLAPVAGAFSADPSHEDSRYVEAFIVRADGSWMPGLALAGLIGAAEPDYRSHPRIELHRAAHHAVLTFPKWSGRSPLVIPFSPEAPPADGSPPIEDNTYGQQAGDFTAPVGYDFPSRAAMAAATTEVGVLFQLSPQELRERFAGQMVLVGGDVAGMDRHRHPDGGTIAGVMCQAVPLESMLRERLFFDAGPLMTACGAVVMAGCGIGAGRLRRFGWLVGAGGALLIPIGVLAGLHYWGILWSAAAMVLAAGIGFAGAALLSRWRAQELLDERP